MRCAALRVGMHSAHPAFGSTCEIDRNSRVEVERLVSPLLALSTQPMEVHSRGYITFLEVLL
jgi:hypothetical protein